MRKPIGLMVVAVLCVLPGCGGSDGGNPEFEGTWKYQQVVNSGKETPADVLGRAPTVTFEGNKMIRRKGGEVVDTWTYSTDPTQDPKRMTITMGESGEAKDYHYYYTIEGDTLTTCHANKRFSNPWNTKLEKGAYFTVYVRVKE